jgi:hypothetical protein
LDSKTGMLHGFFNLALVSKYTRQEGSVKQPSAFVPVGHLE